MSGSLKGTHHDIVKQGFLSILALIKTVQSIVKVLKGKSGKVVRLTIMYDEQMDVLTNADGSPLPDIVVIDGSNVDLRGFKEKWKKELQSKEGIALNRVSTKKKAVTPFLKEDLTTDFETLPEEYDIVYEGITIEELGRASDTNLVTQLSANLKYGSFSKKDLYALVNFSTVIHLVLRCRGSDKATLEKAGQALAKSLKGKLQESPLKPAGMFEAFIELSSKEDRYRQVMGIIEALKANFSSIVLHQVMMTRVPAEQISCISFDSCKRKTMKHHYS